MGCGASTAKPAIPGADAGRPGPSAVSSVDHEAKALPTAWISSSGLPSDELKSKFMAAVLRKRGVFDEADELMGMPPCDMVKKYKSHLEKCKAVHIMDALYFRDHATILQWKKEEAAFFWDEQIIKHCGFLRENVKTVCLNMKPWLFEHPGEEGMWSPQSPKSEVTEEEKAAYMAKLQQCEDAYSKLTEDSPEMPTELPSGKSCADELCQISQELNKKYEDAMVEWCHSMFDESDVVTGQGGDVVNLNMTFQCNQRVGEILIEAVRCGKCIYAAHSAGAMVMAKSMEMTKEIGPGWLEAFAVSKKFLMSGGCMFDANDLDGHGTAANVLGALPMFESPFAMRPHFKEAWMAEVLEMNKKAEAECELESEMEICDDLVSDSSKGVRAALRLLNIVGMKNSADQDHPVFLPLLDGQVIVGEFHGGKECFRVIGTPSGGPSNTKG